MRQNVHNSINNDLVARQFLTVNSPITFENELSYPVNNNYTGALKNVQNESQPLPVPFAHTQIPVSPTPPLPQLQLSGLCSPPLPEVSGLYSPSPPLPLISGLYSNSPPLTQMYPSLPLTPNQPSNQPQMPVFLEPTPTPPLLPQYSQPVFLLNNQMFNMPYYVPTMHPTQNQMHPTQNQMNYPTQNQMNYPTQNQMNYPTQSPIPTQSQMQPTQNQMQPMNSFVQTPPFSAAPTFIQFPVTPQYTQSLPSTTPIAVTPEAKSVKNLLVAKKDRSRSNDSIDLISNRSRSIEPPLLEPRKTKSQDYQVGSKQEKIKEVFASIKEKYSAKNLFTKDKLRGQDVCYVHVRRRVGLQEIENALDKLESDNRILIRNVSMLWSKKSGKQLKGIIVYLRLGSKAQVQVVREIFAPYEERNHFKFQVAVGNTRW